MRRLRVFVSRLVGSAPRRRLDVTCARDRRVFSTRPRRITSVRVCPARMRGGPRAELRRRSASRGSVSRRSLFLWLDLFGATRGMACGPSGYRGFLMVVLVVLATGREP